MTGYQTFDDALPPAVRVFPHAWPPTTGGYVVDLRKMERAPVVAGLQERGALVLALMDDDRAAHLAAEAENAALALVSVYARHERGAIPVPVVVAADRVVVAEAFSEYLVGQIRASGVMAMLEEIR